MLLDIGIGITFGIYADMTTGGLHPYLYPLLGILFSLLPDIDYVVARIRSTPEHEHRNLFHLPLVVLPVAAIVLAPVGAPIQLLACACILLHFLHDSIGIGWGVRWLWPLSRNSFSFVYHLPNTDTHRQMKRQLLYTWRPKDLPQLIEVFGDPHWVRNIYLGLHPYAIVELSVLFAAVGLWVLHYIS